LSFKGGGDTALFAFCTSCAAPMAQIAFVQERFRRRGV